ncbi:hypothetical protein [Sphingobacterium deserti]|uniref:Uncharacterized protein n=1 Tax=Sphingobacterium deserti TaxID=1229276 RepID=A0A0B8T732_9SPHI|nr:hypothetical protein [Sphingobacterium deserti]KGE13375.1 hypothetical protein DI53_2906 [Sphingobacterium deserti]
MNLRFTIWSFTALLLLFTSCSDRVKDNLGDATNFLKVTVDDKVEIYNNVSARWIAGGNSLEIRGTRDGSSWMTISILAKDNSVSVGRYTLDDSSPYDMLATYSRLENNQQFNFTATRGTIALSDDFTLEIEDMNEHTVEGSFSGTLIAVQGLNVIDSVVLKDGSFTTSINAE